MSVPNNNQKISRNRTRSKMTTNPFSREENTSSQAESCTNVFNSVDFGRFLSKEFPKTSQGTSPFLSKDSPLPSFEVSSLFKSKDAFSKMFSSSDWEMKFETQDKPSNSSEESNHKNFPVASLAAEATIAPAPVVKPESLKSILSSREWLPMNTLGTHVDIPVNTAMFGTDAGQSTPKPAALPSPEASPVKTDWDSMFFSQMQLLPPQTPSPDQPLSQDSSLSGAEVVSSTQFQDVISAPESIADLTTSEVAKKKRKRKPRKKIVPKEKLYVEPNDNDVLLGRGGRSNHHPGNKRYREEVKNLQSWYMNIKDKDEKTDLSQCLVDYVHNYQGRFLEKDSEGWYEVPNIVARRKASQALREDTDPAKRAAKRARFLARRAKAQQQKQQPATAIEAV